MDNLERPDGSVVTPIGWGLIVIGVIGAFIGASADTFNGALFGFGLANLGIALGVLLLSLGYLVRAIWFLPAREIAKPKAEADIPAALTPTCDWCGRNLPRGSRTCTSYDREALERVANKVQDPVCLEQLRIHDITEAASRAD